MAQTTPPESMFERRLTGILEHSENADAQQRNLLALLIREIHTVKLILAWVLVIVPIIVGVLGGLLLATAHQTPTISGY